MWRAPRRARSTSKAAAAPLSVHCVGTAAPSPALPSSNLVRSPIVSDLAMKVARPGSGDGARSAAGLAAAVMRVRWPVAVLMAQAPGCS